MGAHRPGRRSARGVLTTPPATRRPSAQRFVYGRRRGHRLRPGRQRLLAERLPEALLTIPESGPESGQESAPESGQIAPGSLFADRRPLWLEIGFGGGEHLAAQAAAHPEVGLIGCEPYVDGVARLLAQAEAAGLQNLRVVMDDARLLLQALPDGSLERIFVLFPDPWPKTRHHKRRIVNAATARQFARLLAPGGEVRLATDDMSYARAMLQALLPIRGLDWQVLRPDDWRSRPADWPQTRYEQKALAAGRRCVYLRFRRVG